jgi:hypothetical protein
MSKKLFLVLFKIFNDQKSKKFLLRIFQFNFDKPNSQKYITWIWYSIEENLWQWHKLFANKIKDSKAYMEPFEI